MVSPEDVGSVVSDNNRVGVERDPALGIVADCGTLPAPAVVVRVPDGAEVGSAVHEYRHGVIDDELSGAGATLPPDRARRLKRIRREAVAR